MSSLLFLLFINSIINELGSKIRLFADHTSLYEIDENALVAAEILSVDLEQIVNWAKTWRSHD